MICISGVLLAPLIPVKGTKLLLNAIFIILLVAADRALKVLITPVLANGATITLIPKIIQLRYTENTGAAFSILEKHTSLLIVFTAVFLIALLYLLFFGKEKNRLWQASLVLLVAGGLGNLYDRIFSGFVVDCFEFTFIDFAIFNLADVFICVGTGLLILYFLLFGREEDKKSKSVVDDE